MQRISVLLLAAIGLLTIYPAAAATKPHVISFGKWTVVKIADGDGQQFRELKVRAILVDSRVKEYSTGSPHDTTERLFVVRRVFRLNDALPHEPANRWQWQWGGWIVVDRETGRISQLNLPEFDPVVSVASWYRDYVAYCGRSEDGKKLYAVVAQVGRRKPILKEALGEPPGNDMPDSACPAPSWERAPIRVTFRPKHGQALLFSVRGRVVDVVSQAEAEEEE